MQGTRFIEKYFFLGLIIASALLVVVIFSPFLTVIILGASLSVILQPTYEKIRSCVPYQSNWFASLLTLLLFLVILGLPLFVLGTVVFTQFQSFYASLGVANSKPLLTHFGESINRLLPLGFAFDIQKEITTFIGSLSTHVKTFFSATLDTIFMFLLTVLTIFYFLKDGYALRTLIIKMSPLDTNHSEQILHTLTVTINGIIKGYLIIAIAQGILMGIGLTIFGVPHPALWGVVAGVVSLVPMIGTAFVAVPAIIFLLITGDTSNAIGLAIWSLTLVGTIDNFLNPLIIGKKTELPPLLILFAVIGGLSIMGPVGILVGPLSVSFFRALVLIYREDIKA